MIDTAEVMGFSQKQKDAFAGSTGRVNIWDGSVRSGKTYTWTLLMLALVAAYQGSAAIVITGKNRDSIYRNVFEPVETLAIFLPVKKYVVYRQGAARATIFGRNVHIIGANDAGAESKIRGMTIGLAFADEITLLHPAFFKQLLSRLSKSYSKLFCTTNPDSQNHWLRKDYLVRVPGCMHYDKKTQPEDQLADWTYWHFTMDDNPSLTEGYKHNLRKEYTGMWYLRFIQGLWVAAEGAIYQMWDEAKHVIDPDDMPPMRQIISLGIDYGTTHPTTGILLGIGDDNKLYAVDEWAPGRLTNNALTADLKEWLTRHDYPTWIYYDPAAASFGLQLYEDGIRRIDKANNDVLDGIRTVASLLDNGNLRISSACKNLIDEIPGYRWDEKAAERGIDKPIKEGDDFCLVAGTLIETPTGPREIETLIRGDQVLLPDGVYTVSAAQLTNPEARVRTIHLSNGRSITGTMNHPILVNNEWVQLGDIEKGQELTSWEELRPSSTEELSSAATQIPRTKVIDDTSYLESHTNNAELTTYTAKSGATTTTVLKFPMDSTSIMLTTITATTAQAILSWWMQALTEQCICVGDTRIQKPETKHSNKLQKPANLPKHGTLAQRGTTGIPSMARKHGKTESQSLSTACNVGQSFSASPFATVTDSVATNANQHGDAHQESTTSNGHVNTVEKNSQSTNIRKLVPVPVSVVGISDGSKGQRVYNLTIEGKHQYIANGLVTHNCDALRYSVYSSRYLWSRSITA